MAIAVSSFFTCSEVLIILKFGQRLGLSVDEAERAVDEAERAVVIGEGGAEGVGVEIEGRVGRILRAGELGDGVVTSGVHPG